MFPTTMGIILGILYHLLGIFIWYYFSLFCHEHGHFFAAKLVGFYPYHLKIGSHSSITLKWLFNSKLELGSYPGGGVAYTSLSNSTRANLKTLKSRLIILLLGGSFANVILLTSLFAISQYKPSVLIFIFLLLELFIIINSLFPMEIKLYGRNYPNDGKLLQSVLSQNYREYYKNAALSYQKVIAKYGDSPTGRMTMGGDWNRLQMVIDAQEALSYQHYDETIRLLTELLRLGGLSNAETAYILDILLSIVINQGQMQYLTQGDIWSKQAMKVAGHSKTIQGSRGAILAELGQYVEAKKILLPLTESHDEAIDFTISCWYLAKIDYQLGNSDKVQYWLKQAEQFGSDDPYIANILNRVSKDIKGNA